MSIRSSSQEITKVLNITSGSGRVDLGQDFIGDGNITITGWFFSNQNATSIIVDNGKFQIYTTGTGTPGHSNSALVVTNDQTTTVSTGTGSIRLSHWNHFAITRNIHGLVNIYVNGLLSTPPGASAFAGLPERGTGNVYVGNRGSDFARYFKGLLSNIQFYNRILTQEEIEDNYGTGKLPNDEETSLVKFLDFENDTSSTAYSKGINHSTETTTPVFSSYGGYKHVTDQATGGIEQTGTYWIEDEKYGWFVASIVAGTSGMFDRSVTRTGLSTLKISTTTTSGRARGCTSPNASSTNTSYSLLKYDIPVKSSTTYRFSVFCKTKNAGIARMLIFRSKSDGTYISGDIASNTISGDNDWTELTATGTTTSDTNCIRIGLFNDTAGNIGDAWFDVNSLKIEEVGTITTPSCSSASLYPVIKGLTSTTNVDVSNDTTGAFSNTYTLTTGISESSADKYTFTPSKTDISMIGLFVVSKGTGNWHVIVHDSSNNIVGGAADPNVYYSNPNIINGQFNYFPVIGKLVAGQTYHVHVYSSVGDGTIKTNVASDMSNPSIITRFSRPTTGASISSGGNTFSLIYDSSGLLTNSTIDTRNGVYRYSGAFTVTNGTVTNVEYWRDISSAGGYPSTSNYSNLHLLGAMVAAAGQYFIIKANTIYNTTGLISTLIKPTVSAGRSFSVSYSLNGTDYTLLRTFNDTLNNIYTRDSFQSNGSSVIYFKFEGITSTCYLQNFKITAGIDTSSFSPIKLESGSNNVYYSSIGPSNAVSDEFSSFSSSSYGVIEYVPDSYSTGTITGASKTQDVPRRKRYSPGENIFLNKMDGSAGVLPTGSSPVTTSQWLEDERLGIYAINGAGNWSMCYDGSVKRTGDYTLKVSATDATGRASGIIGGTTTGPTVSTSMLQTYGIILKPSTQYYFECYIKTLNAYANAATTYVQEFDVNGNRVGISSTPTLSGTNDWTKCVNIFTTNSATKYAILTFTINVVGAASDMWFDVNSVILRENVAMSRSSGSNRVAVRDCGTALRFGNDSIVRATALANLVQNNPATITFDFFSTESGDGHIFANRLNVTDTNIAIGWRASTSRVEGAFFTSGAPNVYKGRFASPTLKKNQWYHFAVVYTGATLNEGTDGTLPYLNGVVTPIASANFGGAGNDNIMTIGAQTMSGSVASPFWGMIDNVRVYNRALSATEISSLYFNNIVPRDGLIGEWLFDESTGTTALDTTGDKDQIDQSQLTTGFGTTFGQTGQEEVSQSFTNTKPMMKKIALKIIKLGNPTDDVVLTIEGETGDSPNGLVYCTEIIKGSSLPSSEEERVFNVPFQSSATKYCVRLKRSGELNSTDRYQILRANTDVYAGGVAKYYTGSSWSTINDIYFKTIYQAPSNGTITGATYTTDTWKKSRTSI